MPRTVICSEVCINVLLGHILSLHADPRREQGNAASKSRALGRLGHGIDVLVGSGRLLRGAAHRFGTDEYAAPPPLAQRLIAAHGPSRAMACRRKSTIFGIARTHEHVGARTHAADDDHRVAGSTGTL